MSDEMNEKQHDEKRLVNEEFEMAADKVMAWLREVVKQGNVRRVIVRTKDGRTIVDSTLTMGAAAGGLLFFAGWPIIALTAVAALVSQVRVQIVRELTEDDFNAEDERKTKRTRIEINEE